MQSLRVPVPAVAHSPGILRASDVTPRGQHRMMSLLDTLELSEKKRLVAAKAFEEDPTPASAAKFADRQRLWYKEAVFYEVYVRAFCDSSGRGRGDIQGLTSKLDYLHQLGVDCLWLLPIYPSPLRDDGYDVADYVNIHPDYGTLQDFKTLVAAVHERSMRIIVDYVPNHSSDQHEWFKQSRSSKTNPFRDFYVWTDNPKQYEQARIIFVDVEKSNWTWDEQAQQYFWHRFYSSQPDLNFDNPKVRTAMLEVLKFWLDIGVDGFRCDAVPFLFEREGTNCESLPETHSFLREMREYVQKCNPDAIILCEACQPPKDVRQYFGNGDEFHMGFHFPLMPRIFLSIKSENYSSLRDIMADTPEIPSSCQWVTFLRNHDELTLEMVTPEERQYMWREYAPETRMRLNLGIRRRLAPLLDNDKRKLELAYSMLFTMPGSPIIYYGDEIGMGDNIYLHDRNGVRTPMQWEAEAANAGFSSAQKTYAPVVADATYGSPKVNVEDSLRDPSSLFHTIRRMIAVRRKHSAFGFGTFRWIPTAQMEVAVYLRDAGFDRMLIVNNLSGKPVTAKVNIPADVISAIDALSIIDVHTMLRYPLVSSEQDSSLTAELEPYQFLWLGLPHASSRAPECSC